MACVELSTKKKLVILIENMPALKKNPVTMTSSNNNQDNSRNMTNLSMPAKEISQTHNKSQAEKGIV
jgi:hypothetical protein